MRVAWTDAKKKRLLELRGEGLTQKECADALGYTPGAVSMALHRHPDLRAAWDEVESRYLDTRMERVVSDLLANGFAPKLVTTVETNKDAQGNVTGTTEKQTFQKGNVTALLAWLRAHSQKWRDGAAAESATGIAEAIRQLQAEKRAGGG